MFVIAAVLAGCGARNEFAVYQTIGDAGWAYGDTITMTATLDETVAVGSLSVDVRHDNDYLFQNLWIEVSYESAQHRPVRDTVNVVLSDKFGNWTGSGFGPRYQQSVVVGENVSLADSTPIFLRHIMRVDTLHHIDEIGVSFKPNEK